MELNKIYNMDCLDGLRELEDESVDLVVTDPPYGLKFMGKDWDKALPDKQVFRECFRVLKPGSFAFVMSAPRSDLQSRMSLLLEDAGFYIGYTPIYWTFASGFPKAMNIGKTVDKRLGKERKKIGIYQDPDGYIRTAKTTGFGQQDNCYGNNCDNFDGSRSDITVPTSDEAKALDGSYAGFQPKPAVEVVIVAMKPLSERTYVDQALCNGKGVTWLDDARIPYENNNDIHDYPNGAKGYIGESKGTVYNSDAKDYDRNKPYLMNRDGRFPANLLVSDDVLNDGMNRKSPSGKVKRQPRKAQVFTDKNCGFKSENLTESGYGDSGSFSRYFSLDSWAVKNLPDSVLKTYPFLLVPKASKSEKNKGCEELEEKPVDYEGRKGHFNSKHRDDPRIKGGYENKTENKRNNNHPTVKPLKLMTYLITLGSRPHDTILDPYTGSGTTCIAAKILNRNYIGFELEGEYKTIADARLKAHQVEPQKPLTAF